jgi:hypothetical protein
MVRSRLRYRRLEFDLRFGAVVAVLVRARHLHGFPARVISLLQVPPDPL